MEHAPTLPPPQQKQQPEPPPPPSSTAKNRGRVVLGGTSVIITTRRRTFRSVWSVVHSLPFLFLLFVVASVTCPGGGGATTTTTMMTSRKLHGWSRLLCGGGSSSSRSTRTWTWTRTVECSSNAGASASAAGRTPLLLSRLGASPGASSAASADDYGRAGGVPSTTWVGPSRGGGLEGRRRRVPLAFFSMAEWTWTRTPSESSKGTSLQSWRGFGGASRRGGGASWPALVVDYFRPHVRPVRHRGSSSTTTATDDSLHRRPMPPGGGLSPLVNRLHLGANGSEVRRRRMGARCNVVPSYRTQPAFGREFFPSPSESFHVTDVRLFGSATSDDGDVVARKIRDEKDVVSTWAGSSRSDSRHVVHFISSGDGITVEEAMRSVLPKANALGSDSGSGPIGHRPRRKERPRRAVGSGRGGESGMSRAGGGDNFASFPKPPGDGDGEDGVCTTSSSFIEALIRECDDPSSPYHHDASLFGRDGPVAGDGMGMSSSHPDDDEDEDEGYGFGRHRPPLEPYELLALGSIWFLPASAPRDPAMGGKAVCLTAADRYRILGEGDYLRVHFDPRRFPVVHEYDWGKHVAETSTKKCDGRDNDDDDPRHERILPGVIVSEDLRAGYVVIEKPAGVPVHSTVDNALENVSVAYGRALLGRIRAGNVTGADLPVEPERFLSNDKRHHQRKKRPLLYVTTPQRLDQNTSGILLVSTKKSFASYFARLLRRKTRHQLGSQRVDGGGRGVIVDETDNLVHKKYRCLVCVCPRSVAGHEDNSSARTSIHDEINVLGELASNRSIITHFLEPSIRAPKVFSARAGNSSWAECMMRITDVGDEKCVRGSNGSDALALDLWGTNDSVPSNCSAVVEIEVELLTGRTHQIRGQLAAEGFPIVGDVLYGGANVPPYYADGNESDITRYVDSETLALQCFELSFPYPDFTKTSKGEVKAVPSDKWKKFRLDSAWWTPFIERV